MRGRAAGGGGRAEMGGGGCGGRRQALQLPRAVGDKPSSGRAVSQLPQGWQGAGAGKAGRGLEGKSLRGAVCKRKVLIIEKTSDTPPPAQAITCGFCSQNDSHCSRAMGPLLASCAPLMYLRGKPGGRRAYEAA